MFLQANKKQPSSEIVQISDKDGIVLIAEVYGSQCKERAAHIVKANNCYEKLLELAAEALWKRDYPQGGSIYKTYDSLNFQDKEIYRKEAIAEAK